MCVLPHRPGPMPDSEHRSRPAGRHLGRQRCYNLPELLEIVPVPGYFGVGPMACHRDLPYFPRPHALRVVSMMSFSSCLTSDSSTAVAGGCGWICCYAIPRFTRDRPYGRPAAVEPPGEPPRLLRPDLQSGAFDRSATHPKSPCKMHKARSPFGASGPCGLRSFDLLVRGFLP
jgi:hypothetical protein